MANRRRSSNPLQEESESEITDLPDVLLQQCLARVPRSYYRSLSRVCKLWQNQICSQSLYSIRKTLEVIDFSLFLKVYIPSNIFKGSTKWYEFFLSSNYRTTSRLFKMPSLLPYEDSTSFEYFGTKIYLIGSSVYDNLPGKMCVSDQWELIESKVSQFEANVVVNNEIYVLGGGELLDPNWAEVFDLKTRKWYQLPSPDFDGVVEEAYCQACAVVKEKIIYFVCDWNAMLLFLFVFDTSSGLWIESCSTDVGRFGWEYKSASTIIDEVLYCTVRSEIWGFNYEKDEWKKLTLMEEEWPNFNVEKMVNMNGRLVVLWSFRFGKLLEYQCVVIEVRKDDYNEVLLGSVVWADFVAKAVGDYAEIEQCFAVSL